MTLGQEISEGAQPFESIRDSDIPELSALTIKKKLFNTRLQNDPKDLQQIISGTLKDITDITKLLLSLNKYRAETMTAINTAIGSVGQDAPANMSDQGILGQKPENVSSIAELMLQDTDTNVYEERNVELTSTAVFNIRGKEKKVLSKNEKKLEQIKKRQAAQKELIQKQ